MDGEQCDVYWECINGQPNRYRERERERAQNERKSKKRKYTIERKLKLHSTENQIENSITENK